MPKTNRLDKTHESHDDTVYLKIVHIKMQNRFLSTLIRCEIPGLGPMSKTYLYFIPKNIDPT